jgi:molecular chaperone GrpE
MADENPDEREEPIIRDKRRIDPETGEVRQPVDGPGANTSGPDLEHEEIVDVGPSDAPAEEEIFSDDELNLLSGQATAEELAAERLSDLQRVTAEYANYRKRTEANRIVERERAIGETVKGLLPVLDDIDRAEKHGDLEDGSAFATIAAKLRTSVERLGLTAFGAVGDPFDPQLHEAIFQQPSADVEADTVADVVETGYLIGSTLIRVAKVVVSVPANG